jgi:MFS family permease
MCLGLFIASLSAGVAIGPILDATLAVNSTWRWLFWITFILCLSSVVIGVLSMNYPVPHLQSSVDIAEKPKEGGFIGAYPVRCLKKEDSILAKLKEVDVIGSILALAISSAICVGTEMGNKQFPWGVKCRIAFY